MLLKGMEFDTAHFITDVSGKYPRLWALNGAHPVTVNRWYKFGILASIRTVAPSFREISELPDWKKRKRASCGRSSTKKKEASTNGRPQFTGKLIEDAPSLLCYKKEAQSSEEDIEKHLNIKNQSNFSSFFSTVL
ncbi:hypothetical protein ACS0TY_001802 [Phlomoides rotata]